jgi:iron complex outermembrane receptor protein
VRYDYLWERAFILNNNTLVESQPTHTYGNVSFTPGVSYTPVSGLSLNLNVGSAYRAPSISELYIMGVHFSDNAYDIGDSTLKSERSYNSTASVTYQNKWVKAKVEGYFNYIDNYIYEKPTLTYVTLISGAYPIFQYTQTNAYFTGANIDATFYIWRGLSLQSKLAVLRAYNILAKEYLVLAPADRWENTAKYQFAQIKKATNLYFTFSDLWVMKQNHVPSNSDYVAPPKGYVLLNAGMGCSLPLRRKKVDISLTVYNLANTAYRDYLNQFRYYADDLGINAVLRVSFTLNYFKTKN